VVCVSKQLNEFLFALGAQGTLVGRDLTSVYPPELQKITSVGYHRALSAEGILSLRPTLFLTDGNFGPDEVAAQLRQVGVPILTLEPGKSQEEAQALLLRLGKLLGRDAEATKVVDAWRKGMSQVLADSAVWNAGPRPRVMVIHFGQLVNDYLGIRRGGVADQILGWAGAENALPAADKGMVRLTPEIIAQTAPDVIVATDVGFDRYGSAEKFATLPGVDLTPAGKARRIYRVDETDVMYFGPRTPDAVRRLAERLHAKP